MARGGRSDFTFFMFLILFLACAGVLLAESSPPPVPAADPDSQPSSKVLPGWLKLGLEIRGRSDNYENLNGVAGFDDSYYLHRVRLTSTVTIRPWFRIVTQTQDTRVAGYGRSPVPYSVADFLDLRQGYVELGTAQEGPWGVIVGRQPLIFGDMRLVSTSNWGNVGTNYDGVRLTRRAGIARVDAFYTFVVTPCPGFDRFRTDRRLSGVYTSLNLGKNAAILDGYLFWKNNLRVLGEGGRVGHSDVYTTGVRSVGRIAAGFDYHAEMALQRGQLAGDGIAAWAGHWEVGRPLTTGRIGTRLNIEYNYATGDHNPHDGRQQSFDQLYPTNVYGTAADFGWRNLYEPVVSFDVSPKKTLKIRTAAHAFWLADAHDALYTFSGAVFARVANAAQTRVGEEIDTRFIYQLSKHLQVWLGYATLFPGPYLREAGRTGTIRYPYAMWTWIM